MRKALATDLDGTLLNNNKMPINNQKAIQELKLNNNLLIISTGRPYNGVKPLIEEYNINVDYNVLLNGALILDKYEKVIQHKHLPYSSVDEIVSIVMKYKPCVSIDTGYESYTMLSTADNFPYEIRGSINSLDEIKDKTLSLISLYFHETIGDKIDSICNEINKHYSSVCIAYRNNNFIDVVPIGCSKGNGVQIVCDMENIKKASLYTIGDSYNDISMFEITSNSFTFNTCEEQLKTNADYLVDSVAECISEHILKDVYAKNY